MAFHLLLFYELFTELNRIDLRRSIQKLGIPTPFNLLNLLTVKRWQIGIDGFISFATVCDNLRPFAIVCDYLRLFATVCDHLRSFAIVCDYLRPFATFLPSSSLFHCHIIYITILRRFSWTTLAYMCIN